jgi:CubicO group peptidase (beta-lactamase class C family)
MKVVPQGTIDKGEQMDIPGIEKIVDKADYFSGVVKISNDGSSLLHTAKGYAKREDGLPNRKDTSFGIASGTKGFTALGILKLIDGGKLSYEDDVFGLLPYDFPNVREKITVRQLLSHTSGIYDYFDEDVVEDFGGLFEKVPIGRIFGPSDMLPLLVEGECYFKPGEKFKYCNSGFVILGMLIEEVSGIPYSDYLDKYITGPLGLAGTGCFRTDRLPGNCAYGYIKDGGGWRSNIFEIPIACTADGGLFTTADDMEKFWNGFLNGNLLSAKTREEALKIQAERREGRYYGLGFYIDTDGEGNVVNYHLVGGDPGVEFYSYYFIATGTILTILGNTSDDAGRLLKEVRGFVD